MIHLVRPGTRQTPYAVVLNNKGHVIDRDALSVLTYAVAHGVSEFASMVVSEWKNCDVWLPLASSSMQKYGSPNNPINHMYT